MKKVTSILLCIGLLMEIFMNTNVSAANDSTMNIQDDNELVSNEERIEPLKFQTVDVSSPQTRSYDEEQSHYLFPSTITGVEWNPSWAPTTESWRHYFQVPYDGYESLHNTYLTVNGIFSHLSTITTNNSNYTVEIISSTNTQIRLYVLATPDDSTTGAVPQNGLILTFVDTFGKTASCSVQVIPSFYFNNQTYGQCTWYAGYIMRNANNLTNQGYGGYEISGNPTANGYPKNKSVISLKKTSGSWAHLVFLNSVSSSTNGSITTLTLYCSDTNWDRNDGVPSSFTAVMKYNNTTGEITQMPVIRNSSYSVYIKH